MGRKHTYSLTTARVQRAFLHQHRLEVDLTRRWAEETIALAEEQGFPFRTAQATILRGWSLAAQGQLEEGLTELQAGIKVYKDSGAGMDLPYYLGLLGDVYLMSSSPKKALDTVTQAISMIRSHRPFFFEAELHRSRANCHRMMNQPQEANSALLTGIEVARRQRAASLEMRGIIDLVEFTPGDKAAEARLKEILATFAGGSDTPDQGRARELLRQVS